MSIEVSADLSNLKRVRDFVEAAARRLSVDDKAIASLVLAVDELVTNIIRYGYRGQPGPIEVELKGSGDDVIIRICDRALPFDPTSVPPPDLTRQPLERPPGGLGVYFARTVMDEMIYRTGTDHSNEVILTKRHIIHNPAEEESHESHG